MEKKKSNLIYKVLFGLFAIALVVVLCIMGYNKMVKDKAQQAYEDMKEDTLVVSVEDENKESVEETPTPTPTATPTPEVTKEATPEPTPEPETAAGLVTELGISVPERQFDWESLKAQNGDIYAWIYVPGTAVDYPIVQHPEDNFYYVDHNLDGSEGYPGTIFTENYNKTDFTDRATIIYGHNMRDGSMFHTLHSFEDPSFFNEYQYAYIYLPTGEVLVYKIFAAVVFSDIHLFKQYLFEKDEDLGTYLNDIYYVRSMSTNYREGINVTDKNHIIIMSTCVGQGESQRYLVNGVLVNDPQMTKADQLAVLGQ